MDRRELHPAAQTPRPISPASASPPASWSTAVSLLPAGACGTAGADRNRTSPLNPCCAHLRSSMQPMNCKSRVNTTKPKHSRAPGLLNQLPWTILATALSVSSDAWEHSKAARKPFRMEPKSVRWLLAQTMGLSGPPPTLWSPS